MISMGFGINIPAFQRFQAQHLQEPNSGPCSEDAVLVTHQTNQSYYCTSTSSFNSATGTLVDHIFKLLLLQSHSRLE